MKNNVIANAHAAYDNAQGNHIAAVFTRNRVIIVDEAQTPNPKDNAKHIIENLNGINTQAAVNVKRSTECADDEVCKEFLKSLTGIDENASFSNFLVIGKEDVPYSAFHILKFYQANKPIVIIGSDIKDFDTDNFKEWASIYFLVPVRNVANYVGDAFNTHSESGIHKAIIFNKTRVMVIDLEQGQNANAETANAVWDALKTYF